MMRQDAVSPGDWPTGFMLIQGNRLESLCALMTTWMRRHPLRPLENELILVQSNGIAQWLKLALARPPSDHPSDDPGGGCGIAAAVQLSLPARFVWQVYGQVLGTLPDASSFDKAPLTWRLYRLLGALDELATSQTESDQLAPLHGFLRSDTDVRRRHQLAERLADLYDQYQVYRADWLAAWQAGEDILIRPDGSRVPVPQAQRWQPLLWRRLLSEITTDHPATGASGASPGEASRAEIHQRFLDQARTLDWSRRPVDLPRRLIVFGISSLPRQLLQVLESIAHLSQVMLFVHNPSRHYWGDLVEGRELFARAYRRDPARKIPDGLDPSLLHLHGHPLLAAWGKQGRDYIRLLDEHDQREHYESYFSAESLAIDLFESPGQDSLLSQLQDDILELRPLAERQDLQARIDPALDRSLAFLVAHGPQREVEILQDQLLDDFARAAARGEPLHPRDILVMVPDIETYAPHIEAVFGRLAPTDRRFIPFHLADRGQRHRNPVLVGLEALLKLPRARCSVSEVQDLIDIPALRARFEITDADLPRLRQWISGANIRWGLDARQRARLDLPEGLEQSTWQFGLRRMLLGFATGGGAPWQGIEPYAEVGGLEAALVGQLERLLEALTQGWEALLQERTPAEWTALIARLVSAFFTPVSDSDHLAITRIQETLETWLQDSERGGASDEPLPLDVVREAILSGLDEPTLSQRFLAGAVNFATLMPMRAIPFRQIWLLGMNDGDYPRSRHPADFDLMANDYRPGDRSRREDDRYLFLEALLSARERLVISWVGHGIRDNAPLPPSVLVGQLRDHLAAGWLPAPEVPITSGQTPGAALVAALTTAHPLQPFSRRYFEPGRPAGLFTHAHEWRAAFAEVAGPPERPPRLDPPTFEAPIDISTLGRFLRHPVRHFYAVRLEVLLADEALADADEETFHCDGLERWAMREAVLQALELDLVKEPGITTVAALRQASARLARAGQLPFPPFDRAWLQGLEQELQTPLERYRALLRDWPNECTAQTVRLESNGIQLAETLTGIRTDQHGHRLRVRLQASALTTDEGPAWHQLLRDWPGHLLAQLAAPTSTRILGPGTNLLLRPLPAATAETLLVQLLADYVQCLTELPPLACRTGLAALVLAEGGRANPRAIYEGNQEGRGERDEHPGYARFWPSYDDLSADGRLGLLSDRLYRPLIAHLRAHQDD